MAIVHLKVETLTITDVYNIINENNQIAIDQETINKVKLNREYLEKKLVDPNTIIYGINTGFGSLCNVRIGNSELEKLQENLILSHSCGLGDEVPLQIAKTIFLLKIINLSKGVSGVRPILIEKMIEIYNAGIVPVIFQQGSLGASGDLAPLAHLSVMLLGKGSVYYLGQKLSTIEVFEKINISPIVIKAKEGLALLNGTQFSLAYGIHTIFQAKKIISISNRIATLSMESFCCDINPFHSLLHNIRPHYGQKECAEQIYNLMISSSFRNINKSSVQDPYSFRCTPQVHGASIDAINHAENIIQIELNSVTDNPNVFHEEDLILSGGNFHAQPLALIFDYLSIALAELGSISERRIYQLINGDRGLPAFLTNNPGLNSGFMIAQYTAASIVSQSKQLCTPSSVDSIVSSKGQEDHVSMAANGATKLFKVLQNTKSVLAIEWMTGAQALDFRRPLRSSDKIEAIYTMLRNEIDFINEDILMHDEMKKAEQLIEKWIHD